MSKKYNINLSKQEIQMMEAWNKLDPMDRWEREKIKLVQKYQK
jgi:deoxyribonuclease-1